MSRTGDIPSVNLIAAVSPSTQISLNSPLVLSYLALPLWYVTCWQLPRVLWFHLGRAMRVVNEILLPKSNYIPLANLEAVVFPSILVSVNSPAVLDYLIPLLQCATRLLTLKLLRLRLEQWRHPEAVLAAERSPSQHAQKHPLNTTFFFFFIKCTFSRWTFQNTMKLWKLWSECNRKMLWLFLNPKSIYSLKGNDIHTQESQTNTLSSQCITQ